MPRKVVFSLVVLLCGLMCGVSAFAQYRAGIQGAVIDPTGAAVSGATLTLTNQDTNQRQQVTSNDSGVFNFLSLAPGRYRIDVEATGFKKKTLQNVTVAAEQTQAVNVQLDVGDVNQTVTVSGEAVPPIDTETGQISATLSSRDVQNLPSLGRDPFQLLRLAPGVFGDASHTNSGQSQNTPGSQGPGGTSPDRSIFQTENQVQVNANGQRNITNSSSSTAWRGAAPR